MQSVPAPAFSDIPLNRGCLAVSKELNELGHTIEVKHSVMTRVMQLGQLFEPNKLLEKWVVEGDSKNELKIAEALMRAAAKAKIDVSNNQVRFDIEDVARLSEEIESKLNVADSETQQN